MFMRVVIAIFAIALLAGSGARADDAGDGKLVLGFSAAPGTDFNFYQFHFRSRDGKHEDYITYNQHTLFLKDRRDFDDADENGTVKILTLPAGDWEIYTVQLMDLYNTTYTPPSEFSIPFTIKPGETTYIGDYKAVGRPDYYKDYKTTGVLFVVSDHSARDVPIAQKKDDKLGTVTVAVPDIAAVHSPFFVPEHPRPPPSFGVPASPVSKPI